MEARQCFGATTAVALAAARTHVCARAARSRVLGSYRSRALTTGFPYPIPGCRTQTGSLSYMAFFSNSYIVVASRVQIALDERRAALCVVSARAEDVHEVRALRKQVWVAPRCSGSKRMHTDGLLRSSCSRARALARRRRSTRWHSGQNRRGAGGAKGKAQRLQ